MNDSKRKDIVQKFHDYQVEWLKSHNDINLDERTESEYEDINKTKN